MKLVTFDHELSCTARRSGKRGVSIKRRLPSAWWVGVGSLIDLAGQSVTFWPKSQVEGFADDAARLYGDFVTASAGLLEDAGDDD